MSQAPNVLLVLNDDMGFSDLGCYGGEVRTPHLDRLAAGGVRLSQFYNTARCSPSRASLLTGLHPHQTGIGILTEDDSPDGYPGNLNRRCVTIAEVLRSAGYATGLSGKWHLAHDWTTPTDAWPLQRGFERFYGTLAGAGSYYHPTTLTRGDENAEHEALAPDFYYTDAISDDAARVLADHARDRPGRPFFHYVAYTAPHWPLHAREEDIAAHQGRFDAGWDRLREERMARLIELGILAPSWRLSERDPTQPAWADAEHKEWQCRRMETYAAQIDRMDRGIGRILRTLEQTGQLENTLIIFLSDNGGCAEQVEADWETWMEEGLIARRRTRDGHAVRFGNDPHIVPGAEDTYSSYGRAWANLSNAPFREYKHWVHEGGIATPLIVHWPTGLPAGGAIRHQPHQLPDIMATILDATGLAYPDTYEGRPILPLEGRSLLPTLRGEPVAARPLFWEHEGNAAVRLGRWKLVRKYPGPWELHDMEADRTELHDLAARYPERVAAMVDDYAAWAARCGVIPRERILALYRGRAGR